MTAEDERHEIVQVIAGHSPPAEEGIRAVSSVLSSWGWDLRVIAPLPERLARQFAAAGMATHIIDQPRAKSIAAHWTAARRLARTLRQARPMLIHAHGLRAALAAVLARRGGEAAPVICSPHLLPHLLSEDPRLGLRRRAYRWVLARCDAIVVETQAQREQLAHLDRRSAERAHLVPYAIAPQPERDSLDLGRKRQLLGITGSAAVVGCAVEALGRRALTLFLDAAERLCMQYPSLEFALIGRDVDRRRYHDLAHERGLMGATVFVDPADRFERAVSSLNALVTPQAGWPSGMLALQALKHGVGVVAPDSGEVAELLPDSEEVTLTPRDDAQALADGIIGRLRYASTRMALAGQTAEAPEGPPMLVSTEFFDIDETWATPGRSPREAPGERNRTDVTRSFAAIPAARSMVGVYHQHLEEN